MAENVFVAVIDGLRSSALGAYGNTTYGTPALDRFAAESFLLDSCFAPSPDLADIYQALWHSRHHAIEQSGSGRKSSVQPRSLPRLFADHGYKTTLITDDRPLTSFTAAGDFDELVDIAPLSANSVKRTDNISDTNLARVFGASIDKVASRTNDKPSLIWLHARGMYGPWDASLAFQELLLDECDPPPVESMDVPDFTYNPESDPDAAFRYATAFAAQVIVLDECWETLLGALDASPENQWLTMIIGARGFPLGEHGRIGGVDLHLHAEQLHVPWLIRFPNNLGRLARSSELTSHLDVLPTLSEWLDREKKPTVSGGDGRSILALASDSRPPWRASIISTSASARSIRTASWCLREEIPANGNEGRSGGRRPPELYVRPDDRWEANDVAKLCPDVVEELRAIMCGS